MKTLYLDIFSGISGDMFIGALLDLGVDPVALERGLAGLRLPGYHLHVARQTKQGIQGTKFDVHVGHGHDHAHCGGRSHEHEHEHEHEHAHAQNSDRAHEHSHARADHHQDQDEHYHHHDKHGPEHGRTYAEIRDLIIQAPLSSWVQEKAIAVFQRIAAAEGKIHGRPPETVHFHEVGAIDSIVDIVGGCIALELLGRPRVLSGPAIEGTGFVHCAHGPLPLPAPATFEILAARGIPITQCEEPHELITPTGAALLAQFAEQFGVLEQFTPAKIGYGLGSRNNRTRPNVLRAVLGVASEDAGEGACDWETDRVTVIETNLDDVTPEILGHCVEAALAAGALDVFHTAVQMKKNRPGVLLTILCATADADRFSEFLLRETSAFGVRRHAVDRRKLPREIVPVRTPYGEVSVKIGRLRGQIVQAAPEYEDCHRLAVESNVPLRQVYAAAIRALNL